METIIELAKRIPNGTETETKAYPISDKVPELLLYELGIELKSETNYVLVLEIQFDTKKVILQEYDELGENLSCETYTIHSDELPKNFTEWIISNIK